MRKKEQIINNVKKSKKLRNALLFIASIIAYIIVVPVVINFIKVQNGPSKAFSEPESVADLQIVDASEPDDYSETFSDSEDISLSVVFPDSLNDSIDNIFVLQEDYIEFANGVYLGEVSDGVMDGEGNIYFDTGDFYQGEIEKGEINGQGTLKIPNLGTYTGSFEDNKRQGEGTFTWINGDTLVCQWEDDKPTGKVKKTLVDGSVLDAEIKDGKYNGTFTTTVKDIKFVYKVTDSRLTYVEFTTKGKTKCSGPFSGGKLNGRCTISYDNGCKYEGMIENNKRKGSGTYTWSDGSQYVGDWDNDKMNGSGTFTWGSNKNSLNGKWKNNAPDGSMKLKYDSKTYTATFSNGKCTKVTNGG